MVAMKSGWRDKQLIEAKLRYQGENQRGERSVVGLNVFMDDGEVTEIPGSPFVLPPEVEKERIAYV